MRPLAASDILKVWEQGEEQSAIDRALTMLAVACPELNGAELAGLSIGQRDARLSELRELTFGPRLDGFTACPQCQARLEFALDLAALEVRSSGLSASEGYAFETDGYALRFPGNDTWANQLTQFITFERKCCPFFIFSLLFEPKQGPIWLRLRGSAGIKEFVASAWGEILAAHA